MQIPDVPSQPNYVSQEQRTFSSIGDSVPESVSSNKMYGPSSGSDTKSSSYSLKPASVSLGSIQFPHSSTSLSTYSHGNPFSGSYVPTSRLPTSSG